MDEVKKIGILGIGGVGSLLASRLSITKHQLYCLGSKESNLHIQENGIQMESIFYGNSKFFPRSIKEVQNLDLLFLAVKGINLISSLKEYKNFFNENTILVSLLNGMDYRYLIRKNFKSKIIIGSIGALEIFIGKDRVVIHKSNQEPKVELASCEKNIINDLLFIKNLLNDVGLIAECKDNENLVIWRKLARLTVISTITSMYDSNIGFARTNDSSRKLMVKLINEILMITSKINLKICSDEIFSTIESLPYNLMTSMQRDIMSKKPSEIEFILKAPLEFGEKIGLTLPVMKYCYKFLINKIENGLNNET